MSGEMMVGGLGSVKERDADVDVVIAKVRQEIEAKAKVSEMLNLICSNSKTYIILMLFLF